MASSRKRLTLEDREDISRALAKGLENKDIAASPGRDESVVSREITRHGGREAYRARKADATARESRSRRPKERKIDTDPELRERVTGDLLKGWSPDTAIDQLGSCKIRRLCSQARAWPRERSLETAAAFSWWARPTAIAGTSPVDTWIAATTSTSS